MTMNHFRIEYDSLHVSQECFLPLNVAIGLRKQNPIKDAMNLRLLQLKEAGIVGF